MKRVLFFLILLAPLVFAAHTGNATVFMEKTWTITSPGTSQGLRLNGTFILRNAFQEIVEMNVTEGASFSENGGQINVIYSSPQFTGEKNITATALVRTAYPLFLTEDPTFFPSLIQIPPVWPGGNGLISYDERMHAEAISIASGKGSQLDVIAALADWDNSYVNYNRSYWGNPASAISTFRDRQGVCVGYTHLFISMANALGFQTRFVSGYAYSDDWQAHAWAEVKIGDSWLPVDPTFGEVGLLDALHVATAYSQDQGEVADTLVAKGDGFNFTSNVSLKTQGTQMFEKTFSAHTVLYGDELEVVIYNPTDFYATPTYTISMPTFILQKDSRTVVLDPKVSKSITYTLDTSALKPGYTHSVPYEISMQGTILKDQLFIAKGAAENGSAPPPAPTYEQQPVCVPMLSLAFSALLLAVLAKKGIK